MKITPIEEDVFFLKKSVSDLTEQIDLLTTLQDISTQIISEFDFDKIVNMFLDLVKEIVNYKSCILYLCLESITKDSSENSSGSREYS